MKTYRIEIPANRKKHLPNFELPENTQKIEITLGKQAKVELFQLVRIINCDFSISDAFKNETETAAKIILEKKNGSLQIFEPKKPNKLQKYPTKENKPGITWQREGEHQCNCMEP